MPTESFTNDFITALEKIHWGIPPHVPEDWCSLIDDIQFLLIRTTREEFFHTFNELYNHGKQIVMTCDRLPSSLWFRRSTDGRLFLGLADWYYATRLETRIAILRKKASNEFSADTLQYIASHVNTNIRELKVPWRGSQPMRLSTTAGNYH